MSLNKIYPHRVLVGTLSAGNSPCKRSLYDAQDDDAVRWLTIVDKSAKSNSSGELLSKFDYIDCTTTGSTSSSSDINSQLEYKRPYNSGIPSITTTIAEIISDHDHCGTISNQDTVHKCHLLYANDAKLSKSHQFPDDCDKNQSHNDKFVDKLNEDVRTEKQQITKLKTAVNDIHVQRVASFTFSPESAKLNKKKLIEPTRKFTLKPLSRTLSYIKHKIEASSIPVDEHELIRWQDSFEALLQNRYGCELFRQFLMKEYSSENLDFWLECETFKKMKPGKKSTAQKALIIYSTYINNKADKEVNLDAATKAATKAAIASGIMSNTFNLAQAKIEQLMAKDSYQRFLKSTVYIDLINLSRVALPPPNPEITNQQRHTCEIKNENAIIAVCQQQP